MKSNIELNIDVVIDEYSKYVYKIIENTVGDSLPFCDKEEIVSDTFYLLWKNSSKINTNLKSYLATIARNCSYAKLRNTKTNFEYIDETQQSTSADFTELLSIKEKINTLTQEEKSLFELFYLEGLKIKEISKLLEINIGNLKIRLYRLRKKLKEEK